ncbi:MAG TPA: hypothetical protein VG389_04520 [Myxococcota bacterium]|jgi:cysteine-rich repeat protein|nr:hypothetical protein [Myxococcota bacterium]
MGRRRTHQFALAPSLVVAGAVALLGAACGRCYGPFGVGHPCVDESDCEPDLACAVGFCLNPDDAGLGFDASFPANCGDGFIEPPEVCDDGNNNDADECSATCDQEFGIDPFYQIFSNQADILFVIDNSGSMCEEQINLRASFQSFIDGLTAFADVDFHISVVTTDTMDPAQSGRLQNVPNPIMNDMDCMVALPPPQDCTTGLPNPLPKILTANTVDLARTFRCIAQVGIDGFGGEAALAAVELALSPPLVDDAGANAGFLRPDSLLAVLFVGDEDDCSVCHDPDWPGQCQFMPSITNNLDCAINQNEFLTPVPTFVGAMEARRPMGRVFTAAIIGLDEDGMSQGPVFADPDPEHPDELSPICESAAGRAAPAPRLEDYTRSFEPTARVASICDADFSPALLDIGMAIGNELLSAVCFSKPPCPGITRDEIRVEVRDGANVYVLDPTEYTLRFNDSCPGDYQLIFTTVPPEGAQATIYYPALSEFDAGCIGYGYNN